MQQNDYLDNLPGGGMSTPLLNQFTPMQNYMQSEYQQTPGATPGYVGNMSPGYGGGGYGGQSAYMMSPNIQTP